MWLGAATTLRVERDQIYVGVVLGLAIITILLIAFLIYERLPIQWAVFLPLLGFALFVCYRQLGKRRQC